VKNLYVIVVLILTGITTKAQSLINQKDPFTGKSVKAGFVMLGRLMAPTGMQLGFSESEGKKFIMFLWTAPSGQNGAFNKQDPKELSLLLKMDSDTIIRFKADSAASKIVNFGRQQHVNAGVHDHRRTIELPRCP